eukprot:SAG22_NODE_526_length_9463_cov_8.286523_2_plen_120_part_00
MSSKALSFCCAFTVVLSKTLPFLAVRLSHSGSCKATLQTIDKFAARLPLPAGHPAATGEAGVAFRRRLRVGLVAALAAIDLKPLLAQVRKTLSSLVLPLEVCCLRQCLSLPSVCLSVRP